MNPHRCASVIGFLATNRLSIPLRLIAGFEFRCDEKEAQAVIERWRSRILAKAAGTQRHCSAGLAKNARSIFLAVADLSFASNHRRPAVLAATAQSGRFEGSA